MAQEFRYPLTRICIRSGSLTLPLAMLSVFPDTGDIMAVDTSEGTEFPLDVTGRRVEGLGGFFQAHALEVNDEVVVRPLEDGRFGITAFKRDRRPDYSRPDVLRRLLDDIVETTVPATEAEIRALHPDLPAEFPLRSTLEQEPRVTLHEGRWQSTAVVEAQLRAAELEAQRRYEEGRRRAEASEREEAQRRAEAAEREAAARAAAEREAAALRAQQERDRLNERAADDTRAAAQRQRVDRDERREVDDETEQGANATEGNERFDWNEPLGRTFRLPWQRQRADKTPPPAEAPTTSDPFRLDRLGDARPTATPRSTVVPTPRSGLFPGDAALNSESLPADPAKTKRAREAFATFGYRIEGLAHGQLMLHADLGRRQYRTLLHVLPDGERLDWAALLARRRDSNAKYLAVVGDHRDLHRLTAPADLARATLWSWIGVDRVRELTTSTMIGPLDLEPHFERDGMFEYGLERFERSIAKRVQERGTLSAVLTALAGMRAPTVFVLEDLAAHGDVPRDQLVRVLERLSEAPFHLVSKVDSGEFCLRYRVHDALDQLGTYAGSLRARLPERQRERVRGLPDGVEPIDMHDVPPTAGAPVEERQAVKVTAPHLPPPKPQAKAAEKPKARPKAPGKTASLRVVDDTVQDEPALILDQRESRSAAPLFTGPGFGQAFGEDEESDYDLSGAVPRRKASPKG
jgi:hypothetical protein